MSGYYNGPEWATAILVAALLAGAFACARWAREQARDRARRDRQREYARLAMEHRLEEGRA